MAAVIDGIHWDFGPDDKITYFDITKSYYLTKYRPINETEGLDFNPEWFNEAGRTKIKTGRYTEALRGTKPMRDFWDEQKRRFREGYEVNGYRVTGDHYFFLNNYNMKTSDTHGIHQEYGFPMFLVFQYEYFHYVEMCELLNLDIAVIKSRGIGWSEIASSMCVRPYTEIPNFRAVVTAYSEGHLKPTLDKIWFQLDWLNDNTDTALRRVRMVVNKAMHKKASKRDKNLQESGHRAEIVGAIVDDPDKLRGDRIQRVFFEEMGANPVALRSWVKGLALITTLGNKRVGTRIGFGTGGSSTSKAMDGLKTLITKPESNNILPFKHNWTPDGSTAYTGYFIPAHRMVFDLIDSRGYCNPAESRAHFENERKKLADDPQNLINYQAEYCFTIDEAFIQKEGMVFPREELAEQLAAIDIYRTVTPPKKGYLTWDINAKGERTGKVSWRDDPQGNILITEHPIVGESGYGYNNLYVGGIDSIDIGQNDSATLDTTKLSDFCIVIKRRAFGLQDPKYVAMYKDRPRDIREAYQNAAKLLTYFGAQAVLEASRTTILTYFRDNGLLNLLMKRPRATMSDVAKKSNSNLYGAPATTKTIDHYIELIYDLCLDYSHLIDFKEMVEQLIGYNIEDKKRFDIVAALGMAELGDEELTLKKPKEAEPLGQKFAPVGWWVNSHGYKQFGRIPQTQQEKNENTRVRKEDSWLYN